MDFTDEQQEYINQLMQDTHDYYDLKMKKLYEENKHLKNQLGNIQKKKKELARALGRKKSQHKKQRYRNGARGSKFNG